MCMKIWICQNLKYLNVPFVCIQGHLTNDTTRDEMYLIKLSSFFFFTVAPLYNFPFINNSSKLFWSKSIPCLEYKFRCCYAVSSNELRVLGCWQVYWANLTSLWKILYKLLRPMILRGDPCCVCSWLNWSQETWNSS